MTTYIYILDDQDRHGAGCTCGLCNANGKSYGVAIFRAEDDEEDREPIDRIYGPSEAAAMANAQLAYPSPVDA
jgi:hypothetical protein